MILGLALIWKEGVVEDLQVWKINSGVCFFGVVVGEEAGVGKGPSEDVMKHHDSDLMPTWHVNTDQA